MGEISAGHRPENQLFPIAKCFFGTDSAVIPHGLSMANHLQLASEDLAGVSYSKAAVWLYLDDFFSTHSAVEERPIVRTTVANLPRHWALSLMTPSFQEDL